MLAKARPVKASASAQVANIQLRISLNSCSLFCKRFDLKKPQPEKASPAKVEPEKVKPEKASPVKVNIYMLLGIEKMFVSDF